MRPEQPTVPDPDPRAAMAALLASTQAQDQAAAVLREAGWTVHAPGAVYWIPDFNAHHVAILDGRVVGSVWDLHDGVNGIPYGVDEFDSDHDYLTVEAAKDAVEAALKGGAK
jgi:hypothetical protein